MILGGMLAASMLAGCGNSSKATSTATSSAAESEADEAEDSTEEDAESEDTAEEESTEDTAEEATSEASSESTVDNISWTFGDITADMIKAAVLSDPTDNGVETVAAIINAPDGETYAAMGQVASSDGENVDNADIYLVHMTSDNTTVSQSDGLNWTTISGTDEYTGNDVKIGFAESATSEATTSGSSDCAVFDESGTVLNAHYLTADQAVVYLGICAGLQSVMPQQ